MKWQTWSGMALAVLVPMSVAMAQTPPPPDIAPASPVSIESSTGTQWLYQGTLTRAGQPVSAVCDVRTGLWAINGQVGVTLTTQTTVMAGLLEMPLDFGAASLDGAARWVAVETRCGADDAWVVWPAQRLYPVPYSIYAGSTHWAGLRNIPAGFADGMDNEGPTYAAGLGLTLNGNQFALAGPYRLPQVCTAGQLPKLGASGWVCANDDDTTYAAGPGLALTGTTFSLLPMDGANILPGTISTTQVMSGAFQLPVTGLCPAGSSIRQVAPNGSVTCEMDDDTTYAAGPGLALTGTTFSLLPMDGANILPGTISTTQVMSGAFQLPVTGQCAVGSAIRVVNADGSVVCQTVPITAGVGVSITPGGVINIVTGTVQNIISQTITGGGGVVVSGTSISLSYTQIISNIFPIGTVIYTTGTCPAGLVVSPALASERQVFDDYLLSAIGSAISSTANLIYADDLNTSGVGRPGARVADFADALVPPRQVDFVDTWSAAVSNLFAGDQYGYSQESDGLRLYLANPTSNHQSPPPPSAPINLRYTFARAIPGGGTVAFRWQGDAMVESCTSGINATYSIGFTSSGGARSNEFNIELQCGAIVASHISGVGGLVDYAVDFPIAVPFALGTWYTTRIDYSGGTFTYCVNSVCGTYTPSGVYVPNNLQYGLIATSINAPAGSNVAARFRNTNLRWATSGTLTSDPITRSNAERWGRLTFERATPTGTAATVDVLNATTGAVLLSNVSSGADLSALTATSIRLRGTLTRPDYNAQSPTLYRWSVTTRDALMACVR